MHRTTTTATLLVTVAVAALTGCVTVHRPPASAPAAPARPQAPRPDGSVAPRVVQAPAREALELSGPSHPPKPTTRSASPRSPAPAPDGPRRVPHPLPRHHHPRLAAPRAELPVPAYTVPAHVVPANPDPCALGRTYGGWQPNSPEFRICNQAYGH
ncbi:lipoprotein [Streptomyces anandii JCM 4720]|nr:lipoprotein [Streptomyces anandii JCM 4720]